MIGRCENCHKIRKTSLPSGYSPTWLIDRIPIRWYCNTCYWTKRASMDNKTVEVVDHRTYLMPLRHVLPFLGSVATIIMICLEIAWHTS